VQVQEQAGGRESGRVGQELFHGRTRATHCSSFQEPGAAFGRIGAISFPVASRRSQSSRSRLTNGMAARCRAAAALATGGPKSLIS
jgi:hypothetical protein